MWTLKSALSFDSSDDEGSWLSDGTGSSCSTCLRLPTHSSTSKPQVNCGQEVWPEYWGITRQQIGQLLEKLRNDTRWSPDNTVYDLVHKFIVPWTAGHGIGYALLLNREDPREVNIMVSHAFGENAEQFLEAVLRATTAHDVLYICALSNYQAEDGRGPTIAEQLGSDPTDSPFQRVIQHVALQGKHAGCRWRWYALLETLPVAALMIAVSLFCAPRIILDDAKASALPLCWQTLRVSGAVGFLVASASLRWWILRWPHACSGRMLVVPNHQVDIYTRLWCVFEVFAAKEAHLPIRLAPTLASAGTSSARHATCGTVSDLQRIRGEIEKHYGYETLDRAILQITRGNYWHVAGALAKYVLLQLIPFWAWWNLRCFYASWRFWIVTALAYSVSIAFWYAFARYRAGVLYADMPRACLAVAVVTGCEAMVALIDLKSLCSDPRCLWFFLPLIFGREAQSFALVFLAALCRPSPSCFRAENRISTLLALLLLYQSLVAVSIRSKIGHQAISGIIEVALLLCWNFSISLYMVWTESIHLGIRVSSTGRFPHATSALAWIGLAIPLVASIYRVVLLK